MQTTNWYFQTQVPLTLRVWKRRHGLAPCMFQSKVAPEKHLLPAKPDVNSLEVKTFGFHHCNGDM